MAAEPFVLGLTSLAEFYACKLATGRGEDLNVRKAMETSVEKMVSDLARVKLKIAESSALLAKLAEVDLPDWIKVQLHDAINANTDDARVRGRLGEAGYLDEVEQLVALHVAQRGLDRLRPMTALSCALHWAGKR